MELLISPNGTVRSLYDDDLTQVFDALGAQTVRRASHVEPCQDSGWTADMSPVGGPVLGPYGTRREALAREVEWLIAHDIPVPVANP